MSLFFRGLKLLFYIFFRPVWWLGKLIKRDKNVWVLGSRGAIEYSDSSKYLYEYINDNHKSIYAVWITKSNDVYQELRSKNLPVCKFWSWKGIKISFKAGYCFLCTSRGDVNSILLNGCKIVWLWHGMPLKKIGFDRDHHSDKQNILQFLFKPWGDMFAPGAMLTSSPFFTPFLRSAWNYDDDSIWKTGLPRCDVFYSDRKDSYIEQLRIKFPKCRILLYMPTFRMVVSNAAQPFNPFVSEYGFNKDKFTQILEKGNIVFIYKPHVVDRTSNIDIDNERFVYLHYSDVNDTYELLNSVDGLITDYSSVYFDFLCSRKPLLLLTPDYDDYVKNSRGHYFDMFNEMSAPVFNNWGTLGEYISQSDWKCPDNKEINKFAEYSDGKACEKLVQHILTESKSNESK